MLGGDPFYLLHHRATSVQPAIGSVIFQITGKRLRDLPYGKHDLTWS